MKLNRSLLARAIGLPGLEDNQVDKLQAYAEGLKAANRKINLLSRGVELEEEIEKQIAISLIPFRLFGEDHVSCLDIGSGGGFPAIPLAIMLPDILFTLVEPVAKKAFFLERVAQSLDLSSIKVLNKTAEEVMKFLSPKTSFDVVSIKAVADLDTSLGWAKAVLCEHGIMFTFKPGDSGEAKQVNLKAYGFKLDSAIDVNETVDGLNLKVLVYEKL